MTPGLYSLFLKRLCDIKTRKEIIPFPLVFEKVCSNFSITKYDCWGILSLLEEKGIIELHSCHGIKILKRNIPKKVEVSFLLQEIKNNSKRIDQIEPKNNNSCVDKNPGWVNIILELAKRNER